MTRGFLDADEERRLLGPAVEVAARALAAPAASEEVRHGRLTNDVRRFLERETGRRTTVLPISVE
jgi:hypothetical protein